MPQELRLFVMPNASHTKRNPGCALLAALLLLLPALQFSSAAQSRHAASASPESRKPRKLAPDLVETLDAAEQTASLGKTLGQMRQAKHKSAQAEAGSPAARSLHQTERVIVKLSARATEITLKSALLKVGGRLRQIHHNLNLVSLELPLEQVRALAAEPDIEYVSPDRPLTAFGHIETTTGAEQVRRLVSTLSNLDGTGVGIAIIDSGVDVNHKLMRATAGHPGVTAATDFITADSVNDRFGHGTFVASLAAGSNALEKGAYEGIAPSANLINLKVLDDEGAGFTSSLIAALDWCIFNRTRYNLRVANLSIGTLAKDSYQTDPLCLAARRAHAAGILVVAAAGNDGKDKFGRKQYGAIHSPGIDPSVLTVGAATTFFTDRRSDDRVASYSSRGPTRGYYTDASGMKHYDNLIKPDLVAPGNRVISASSRNPDARNDLNNLVLTYPTLAVNNNTRVEERLMYLSGTSVAAPIVAGAAALLFEANPNLTPNLVKAILMYSAQPIAGANNLEQGAGLLNIDGAVRIARLVRATLPTTNGSALLTAALPVLQTSSIVNETCRWGQSVITNYCFLYGSNLMRNWQGIYGRNVVLADATTVINGVIQQVPGMTSPGVQNSAGIVFASTGVMADGTLMASGVVFADGITYSSGVVFADGRISADETVTPGQTVKAKVIVVGD